ncbi:hypothetical protein BJY14_004569 [Actinomadura luteofluorescens]|uniref:Uncharacterized protein n=1 Tax=Actinomadura luteofluorescens TaxID=46163 RepID=A0A7Y9EJA4_9ACTN|nr:hypothetical protein [Actinomadura luteofluorescens]NYD48586.1 hypothetical protein [Actinomadura luteofluorescens]
MPIITSRPPTSRAPVVGVREMVADLRLQGSGALAAEFAGRDVDLQVELAQLGRPRRVRDRLEHVRVAHQRVAERVDQVELDLQAYVGALEVELGFAQHPGQYVEAPAHLVAIPPPVLAADGDRSHVPAHVCPSLYSGGNRHKTGCPRRRR